MKKPNLVIYTKVCCLIVSLLQLDSPLEYWLFAQPSQWQTNPLSEMDPAEESCITLNWKLSLLSERHYHSNFWPRSSKVLLEWWILSVLFALCSANKYIAWERIKIMFKDHYKPFRQHMLRTWSRTISNSAEGLTGQEMQMMSFKWSCLIHSPLTAEL